PQDVRSGDRILLCDGNIELRVEGVAGTDIHTRVGIGGTLAEHQGINLPGVPVSAPALTPKDRDDLAFGVAHQVDYIALSFVRRAQAVRETRAVVRQLAAAQPDAAPARQQSPRNGPFVADRAIPIIAKIEKPEAVQRLDAILEAADGVMVARGDLGVEMPLERVPLVQKRIIARANALGLPVITATQMLESMITHARPTRAEASDV